MRELQQWENPENMRKKINSGHKRPALDVFLQGRVLDSSVPWLALLKSGSYLDEKSMGMCVEGKLSKTKKITGKQTIMIILLLEIFFQIKILEIHAFSYLLKCLRAAVISST